MNIQLSETMFVVINHKSDHLKDIYQAYPDQVSLLNKADTFSIHKILLKTMQVIVGSFQFKKGLKNFYFQKIPGFKKLIYLNQYSPTVIKNCPNEQEWH